MEVQRYTKTFPPSGQEREEKQGPSNKSLIARIPSSFFFFFFFFFFVLFRAAPVTYRDSQARRPIGTVAAGLHHGHSNVRSKLNL